MGQGDRCFGDPYEVGRAIVIGVDAALQRYTMRGGDNLKLRARANAGRSGARQIAPRVDHTREGSIISLFRREKAALEIREFKAADRAVNLKIPVAGERSINYESAAERVDPKGLNIDPVVRGSHAAFQLDIADRISTETEN